MDVQDFIIGIQTSASKTQLNMPPYSDPKNAEGRLVFGPFENALDRRMPFLVH